jgi:hypothetical protein
MVETAEAFNGVPAGGAKYLPFHLEQANLIGVEEEVYGFLGINILFSGEAVGVGAEKGIFIRGIEESLKFGNDTGVPGPSLFQQG